MNDFNRKLKIIKTIFKEVDPLNLIASGSPGDEYDREAGLLCTELMRINIHFDIDKSIERVFASAFNQKLSNYTLKLLSERLSQIFNEEGE